MFHAVAGGAEHPTRKILDRRDPYNSTLINASARHLLDENGVPVRQDASNRWLHSKYQVIDDRLAVIGSHNWSAGSGRHR